MSSNCSSSRPSLSLSPPSFSLERFNSLFSPSSPFTLNSTSAKYPEPLTRSPGSIIIITLTASLSGFKTHQIGMSSPPIFASFTSLIFTTSGSKDRSNCAELRSVTSSISIVATKVAPSSTYSGALTLTSTSCAITGVTANDIVSIRIRTNKTAMPVHFKFLFPLLLFPFSFISISHLPFLYHLP